MRVGINRLGAVPEGIVQLTQTAVGLYVIGTECQHSAKQRFRLWRALLAHADLRHEVKRPYLVRLLRQDAPELLFRIVEPVLNNEPGNRAARSRLRQERLHKEDKGNQNP